MSNMNELPEVSLETLAHFEAQRTQIVHQAVERSMNRQAEVVQHGEQARQLITVGLDFTTQAVSIAMQMRNAELLKQQLIWGNDRLPHDRVEPTHILARLRILADVVRGTLTPTDAAAVNQYIGYLIALQEEIITSTLRPA